MKVLLIGEFSSLHYNLKKGLEYLGDEVTLVSAGDGFKNIPRDIDLSFSGGIVLRNLKKFFKIISFIPQVRKYDIVQIINPFCLFGQVQINALLLKLIIKLSRKSYLLAAGCDAIYWQVGRYKLNYGPFEDSLKYDVKKSKNFFQTKTALKLNLEVANLVDGIIPIMYEYSVSYEDFNNRKETIPLPIDFSLIEYKSNILKEKLVVFHGLNRYGFKGTKYVEEAFSVLSEKYSDVAEFVIEGKLPINEYLALMEKSNVVIDQTNSYSLGLNGVAALAMGKIVLGGAEPESLAEFNILNSPVINIKPCKDSIILALEELINERRSIQRIGLESRLYAEKYHDHIEVAKLYKDTWNCNN